MKKIRKSILAVLMSSLVGCAQLPLIVGQPRAEIASEDVIIYYSERPRCNFETIAHIRVTGGYLSLESMLGKMRQQAAEVGASGLYVLQTQQLDVKEFLGTAKAIRCSTV